MAFSSSPDDVAYLSSPAGDDALAAAGALALTDASLLADLTRVRRSLGDRAAGVVETIRLRRRAAGRMGPAAASWLFTDEALQQASPWPVARHRAQRLAGLGVHDLTCSIGADLAALSAEASVAVGSDLDPVRASMAAHNLATAGLPARIVVADALAPVTRGLLGYADPARRDGTGRRITSVSTLPSVADLDRVYVDRPPVLRLPPGIDYESLARPGEVEIVSLDGGAREAVLWPAELASVGRRATVLASVGRGRSWEVTSDDPSDAGVVVSADSLVGEFLVDPDPAVVRAHLVRHYAVRCGLRLLDPHLAYLVGPATPVGVRSFLVLDAAPYREKVVAEWAR